MINFSYENIKIALNNLNNEVVIINKKENKMEFAANIIHQLNTIEKEIKLHEQNDLTPVLFENLEDQIKTIRSYVEKNLLKRARSKEEKEVDQSDPTKIKLSTTKSTPFSSLSLIRNLNTSSNEEIADEFKKLLLPDAPMNELIDLSKDFLQEALNHLQNCPEFSTKEDLLTTLNEYLMVKRFDALLKLDRTPITPDMPAKTKLFTRRSKKNIETLISNYDPSSLLKMNEKLKEQWISSRRNLSSTISGISSTEIPKNEQELAAENWLKADEFTKELASKGQTITTADICEIHLILAKGLPNNGGEAGKLRNIDMFCGDHYYIPGSQVATKMEEFTSWLKDNLYSMDPIDLAALASQRLVSIHPFSDGNGRVSRFVMDYILQLRNYPPALMSNEDSSLAVFANLDDKNVNNVHPLEAIRRVSVSVERSLKFINEAS